MSSSVFLSLSNLASLASGLIFATIVLVLEIMRADVFVDLTRDLGASHLSALRLAQELSELGADKSGLYKTAGGTVALSTALLGTSLLSSLHLASPTLLKRWNSALRAVREAQAACSLPRKAWESAAREASWKWSQGPHW